MPATKKVNINVSTLGNDLHNIPSNCLPEEIEAIGRFTLSTRSVAAIAKCHPKKILICS